MKVNNTSPPKLFLRFFRWFCHPQLKKYIEGDLIEIYDDRVERVGKTKADRLFVKDVLLLFRPSIIRPAEGFERLNHYGMFKNYFKVALRNLSKNKSYVLINTLGMGIALACCITAYLLLAFNIEFDYYFKNTDLSNTVKLVHYLERDDGSVDKNLVAPMVMPPIASEDISGIETFTRYLGDDAYVSYGKESFQESISFADEDFFEIFNFNLKWGSVKNFSDPKSIFLSTKMADKYFPDEDPIGKLMVVEMRNKEYELIVGGVLNEVPLNSTFYFDFLIRIENFIDVHNMQVDSWGQWRDVSVAFKLTDISQRESIAQQLDKYVKIRNEAKRDAKTLKYELIPFSAKLDPDKLNWSYFGLPISFVPLLVFITLGSIILLIACFNLTNTTIALTVKRLKEIGVRKVVGAARSQIVSQFLLEMTITVTISIVVGLLVAQFIVPEFAAMWGLAYGLADLNGINLFISLAIILFLSAILSGAYPALFNSKFRPVVLLKGNLRIKGTNPLTRVLLAMQFSLSVIVLVAGIFFTQNAGYQQKVSFGYDKENVFIVRIEGEKEYQLFKTVALTNAKIENLAVADHHFGFGAYRNPFKIDTNEFTSYVYEVGANYFDVMGLEFVEGRDFLEESKIDFESAAIVDQNFMNQHQLVDPLNTQILFQGVTYNVIGVVKNHLSDLSDRAGMKKDHFYRMAKPEQYQLMAFRVAGGDIFEVQDELEKQWKSIFPNKPFRSSLQEDIVFAEANNLNQNLKKIFLFLTVLGCILSVSGIFALASLNVEKRTKEIGVRKVLGASVSSIVKLINKEFAIILGVAMILGGTCGYFLTFTLMEEIYTQHIPVTLIPIILCGLFIFTIGIITTSGTIVKSAKASPVETLKNE